MDIKSADLALLISFPPLRMKVSDEMCGMISWHKVFDLCIYSRALDRDVTLHVLSFCVCVCVNMACPSV